MASFIVNFVQNSPLLSIIAFSFIITFFLTLAYKKLVNQKKFNEFKEKQKELREKFKEYANQPDKIAEIQKEMMQSSAESMRLTLKPMIITILPLLIVFWLLKKLYMDLANVGNIIHWGAKLPLIGTGAGWLLCYIIFSFIFSLILRKLFKM